MRYAVRIAVMLLVAAILGNALATDPSARASADPFGYTVYVPLVSNPPPPTPTSTPIPPTPTATPVPPTPTPRPQGVYVLSHSQYKPPYSSYYYVVGEVLNNSDRPVYHTTVTATFYNEAGQVAGSNYSYTELTMILAGEKAPFRIMAQAAADWTYEVAITNYDTTADAAYNHNFAIINAIACGSGSDCYVVGEVQNNTADTWQHVKAMVTLYDSAGTVIDTDYNYLGPTSLAPGAKSSFSVSFYGPQLASLSDYAVAAEGWK